MKQKEISSDPKWVEDEYVDDAEVIKLKVGESIEGLLMDKYPSTKYNAQIYKIKVRDEELLKVLVGTTILDKLMKNKEVNDEIKIERVKDIPSLKGNPLQDWKVYHKEE